LAGLLALLSAALGQQPPRRALLLVSIDGMGADYLLKADEYQLKIPVLRRLMRDGARASGVTGVLPTVTYASHTTLLTGASPAKHGIYNNSTFDPLGRNSNGWYWYAEDIRVPTLWQAASQAGYVTGSISWPVSVGAAGVRYLIPEYWRAAPEEDIKLVRALSTPGILQELEKSAGKYVVDLDKALPADWARTRYAAALLREKGVRFLTLHLGAVDHVEHASGPYSPESFAALEEIDRMLAVLEESLEAAAPGAAICIVSDHGFARTDTLLSLNAAFARAGLITPNPNRSSRSSTVNAWRAQAWSSAGSAAIMLKDPKDEKTRARVEALLKELAADPANGIVKILDRRQIAEMGGPPDAAFFVDVKPGFVIVSGTEGPLLRTVRTGGAHGYSPEHPELLASFIFAGPGVKKGLDLGRIDMRSIAPTLAGFLEVPLPSAELPPLDLAGAGSR
jgi:predicted AlkP superfamily pyrophosphatase or phosphodiesterase